MSSDNCLKNDELCNSFNSYVFTAALPYFAHFSRRSRDLWTSAGSVAKSVHRRTARLFPPFSPFPPFSLRRIFEKSLGVTQ